MTEAEEKLLHKYLDGSISPEEFASLEKLLLRDAEARQSLRTFATIDSKWQELVVEQDAPEVPAEVETRSMTRVWQAVGGIAALLLLGLFLTTWNRSEPAKGVARVIHIEGEAKANGQQTLASGDELYAGDQLTMGVGLIELAYRETGVHVLATAPLELEMDSTRQVNLRKGEMKLVVPPQGVGFVVDTPERKITDLGTSFVVKAGEMGSRVLVLDGQVAINGGSDLQEHLMEEGDHAKFGRDGKIHFRVEQHPEIPELTQAKLTPTTASFKGKILGFEGAPPIQRDRPKQDVIARQILPLINSGFEDPTCLDAMKQGVPIRFSGIAGNYKEFPHRSGLTPYSPEFGWMVWYRGQVMPPQPGRYRFWGYADNHLLVAIDGKPVFEGSRRDSPFKELGISRSNHPSYPCLNATAGFASGPWFELGSDGVQLDIVFGEIMHHQTSGLLLVEREGASYKETYWGQPRWPLFLTEPPTGDEVAGLENLRRQMESKLIGSFSVSEEAQWKVLDPLAQRGQ